MWIQNRNFRVYLLLTILLSTAVIYGCGPTYVESTFSTNTPAVLEQNTFAGLEAVDTLTPTPVQAQFTDTPEAPTAASLPVGVSDESTEPNPTAEPIFSPTPNPYVTATPLISGFSNGNYNPLTGLSVDDAGLLDRSPVLVKISNFPREIRPQSGLSKADIVFEYYIGGFMNRFLAVYYGENAEWAGPIRSGRLIDAQLANNYQGILVYGGADERVNAVITAEEFLGDRAIDTRFVYSCPPICGTDTHSLEGVYVDTAMMSEWAFMMDLDHRHRPYPADALFHTVEIPPTDSLIEASEIEIITSDICRSKWIYDPSTVSYLRWEEAGDRSEDYVPSIDVAANLLQVDTQNILILFSDYVVYDAMLHDIRIHYADDLMPAIYFRNGYQFTGYWSGMNAGLPLQFFDDEFAPFPLAPGKSWVVFVTEDSVFIPADTPNAWQVIFTRP